MNSEKLRQNLMEVLIPIRPEMWEKLKYNQKKVSEKNSSKTEEK